MTPKKLNFLLMILLLFSLPISAASDYENSGHNSLIGMWLVIDDKKARSRIYFSSDSDGTVSGKVVYLSYPETPGQIPRCIKCKNSRKNDLVVGMTIIEGLKYNGKLWAGGKILNPSSGIMHDLSIELTDEGKKLKLISPKKNQYKGSKILGKSLSWDRY